MIVNQQIFCKCQLWFASDWLIVANILSIFTFSAEWMDEPRFVPAIHSLLITYNMLAHELTVRIKKKNIFLSLNWQIFSVASKCCMITRGVMIYRYIHISRYFITNLVHRYKILCIDIFWYDKKLDSLTSRYLKLAVADVKK